MFDADRRIVEQQVVPVLFGAELCQQQIERHARVTPADHDLVRASGDFHRIVDSQTRLLQQRHRQPDRSTVAPLRNFSRFLGWIRHSELRVYSRIYISGGRT
jgi:hypothetical protein